MTLEVNSIIRNVSESNIIKTTVFKIHSLRPDYNENGIIFELS